MQAPILLEAPYHFKKQLSFFVYFSRGTKSHVLRLKNKMVSALVSAKSTKWSALLTVRLCWCAFVLCASVASLSQNVCYDDIYKSIKIFFFILVKMVDVITLYLVGYFMRCYCYIFIKTL